EAARRSSAALHCDEEIAGRRSESIDQRTLQIAREREAGGAELIVSRASRRTAELDGEVRVARKRQGSRAEHARDAVARHDAARDRCSTITGVDRRPRIT